MTIYCRLQHPFLQGDLTTQITRDLLQRTYNSPMTFAEEDDADIEEDEVLFHTSSHQNAVYFS